MLEVSSYGFKRESAPYAISPNTRLNCSVALTKLYDDLGGDKARGVWDDQVIEYVQYVTNFTVVLLFDIKIMYSAVSFKNHFRVK